MPTSIRIVSIATLGVAAWLAAVVVLVLPARNPAGIGIWTIIAIGAAAFGLLSMVITDPDPRPRRTRSAVLVTLVVAALALAALLLGVVLIGVAGAPHPEGYLLLIGLIFASHGSLVLLWLAARAVTVLNRR